MSKCLVIPGRGFVEGHVVDHASDTVDVRDEPGDQSFFDWVPGPAAHRDHAIVGRYPGVEHAGLAMRQQ